MPKTDRVQILLAEAGFEAEAVYQNMRRIDSQLLYSTALDLARAEERAADAVETVRDTAERVAKKLTEGSSLNELGELQGRALDMDRSIAVLTERQQTWSRTVAAVKRMREAEQAETEIR